MSEARKPWIVLAKDRGMGHYGPYRIVDVKGQIVVPELTDPDIATQIVEAVNASAQETPRGCIGLHPDLMGHGELKEEVKHLRATCDQLRANLDTIAAIAEGSGTLNSLPHIAKIARG